MSFARLLAIVAAGSALAVAQPAPAQQGGETPLRSVNITADSARGWIPSVEDEERALAAAEALLAKLEAGEFADVYRMLTDGTRELISRDDFVAQERDFRTAAGPLVRHNFNQLTWTKDSLAAPAMGTYIAIDMVAEYANVDRYCGYVVLYRSGASGPFQLARLERNFITNAEAQKIGSPAELQASWRQLTAHCPNYRPLETP